MKIGVALPHYGAPAAEPSLDRVVAIARECERLGFDSVWVSDHLVFDLAKYGGTSELIGSLEPLTTLAAVARETSTLRLGTMVLNNEFRHPVVLAKQAANIDRLELGLGAGWYEREFAVTGLRFPPVRERMQRLRESVEILKLAFSGEPASFRGEHYAVDGFFLDAAAVPTIWVGGKGDRMLRLIAELGVGWNAAWFQDVDTYKERAERLGGARVKRSIGQYAEGTAEQMVDRLASFGEAEVEHAVMCFSKTPYGLDDPDDVARFAQDVLPHVHTA